MGMTPTNSVDRSGASRRSVVAADIPLSSAAIGIFEEQFT